jgi:hypothetical protein
VVGEDEASRLSTVERRLARVIDHVLKQDIQIKELRQSLRTAQEHLGLPNATAKKRKVSELPEEDEDDAHGVNTDKKDESSATRNSGDLTAASRARDQRHEVKHAPVAKSLQSSWHASKMAAAQTAKQTGIEPPEGKGGYICQAQFNA